MKRKFFLLLLCALAGALLFDSIRSDAGYVLISLGTVSIEMSFWLALFLWLLGSAALWLLVVLGTSGIAGLKALWVKMWHGKQRRARRKTFQGLLEFMAGNWRLAKKQLLQSAVQSEMPLVNYLAAAHSSYEMGQQDQAYELLHKADQLPGNHQLVVLLTQARMQLDAKQYEQCLAALQRARELSPHHPVLLNLSKQVYLALSDWRAIGELLPLLRKYGNLPGDDGDTLEAAMHRALLLSADKDIDSVWHNLPNRLQKEAEFLAIYVELLMAHQREEEAETLLRKQLPKQWDKILLLHYGKVVGADVVKQLQAAEQWEKERPNDSTLLLTLGRLSLRNQLWGKARDYFEQSVALQEDPQTHAELARLYANLGQAEQSTDHYRRGLQLSAAGLPELPQPANQ